MKLREKKSNRPCTSNRFNIHALSEIEVGFGEDGADSCYIKDFDVWLVAKQEWKDLAQAFKDRDVIVDNYNTYFFEPKTTEDRAGGFTL